MLLGAIVTGLATVAVEGLVLMAVFALVHNVAVQVPAYGYGASVVIAFAASLVVGLFKRASA